MTASPETLHLLAHQAQRRARSEPDWWDNPLDTALAAVSATRHAAAFREEGEHALDRLRRWHRDGQARRVSADVTAIALAAAAAADFARRDRDLERAAADGVDDLARRSRDAAPVLHLALSAWALDRVVLDRGQPPWLALRERFHGPAGRTRGLDAPLTLFTSALAAEAFDAAALVRSLLSEAPTSPGAEDGAVLLWLLTAAIDRCAVDLREDDTGLRALTDRRSELAARLAQELDAASFEAPEVAEFDPDIELGLRPTMFLSPMEALLLDISLASAHPEQAWLRYEEADALFGARARDLARQLARRTASLLTLLGAATGVLLAVALTSAGVAAGAAVPAGLTLTFAGLSAAAAVAHRTGRGKLSEAIGVFAVVAMFCAAVNTVNQSLSQPVLSDAAGMITGAVIATLAVAVWAASTFVRDR